MAELLKPVSPKESLAMNGNHVLQVVRSQCRSMLEAQGQLNFLS